MRRGIDGSALVEALVATVLVAVAGAVVATAAASGLRATRRAATLARIATLAGRELAALTTRAAVAASEDGAIVVAGFPGFVQRTTDVARADGIATLQVRVSGGRPVESVTLATRVQVDTE